MPLSDGNAYSARELEPLLLWFAVAGTVALLSAAVPADAEVWRYLSPAVRLIGKLVPSIETIAHASSAPHGARVVLGIQWFFAPVYAGYWFGPFAPWKARMREAVQARSRTLTARQRYLVLPIGILILTGWTLGNVGVVAFPTLYNGGFAYPIATAVPLVRWVYVSEGALAMYAWLCPIAEVCLLWMLSLFVINLRAYLVPPATSHP